MRQTTFLILLSLMVPGCFVVPDPAEGELQPVPGPPPVTTSPPPVSSDAQVDFIETQPPDQAGAMIGADVNTIEPLPEEPAPEPAQPRIYTIEKGDSYWKIAKKIYGDGMRMKDIEAANPEVDPMKLRVGDEIILPE